MAEIAYRPWTPRGDAYDMVMQADQICRDYAAQGYDLTLRQCYYQFVARGLISNSQRSYKRLGDVINKARMAGLLDWDYIVDRTRNLEALSHWAGPASILRSAARSFNVDTWDTQPTRVEVWVEKEALAGVVERAAQAWDCAYFSCRGYVSQSEQWAAAQRIGRYLQAGQRVAVIHLGDHDPSGIDMTRDIRDRIETFIVQDWANLYGLTTHGEVWDDIAEQCEKHESDLGSSAWWGHDLPFEVRRIALNMDQVIQYDPPPNPTKLTDSRSGSYLLEHGQQSWELDALDPATLDNLIQQTIAEYVDMDVLEARREEQEQHRGHLETVADRWEDVVGDLDA